MRSRISFGVAIIGFALGLTVAGCSKKNDPVKMPADRFDTASPKLKNKWNAAAGYASRNNYLGAATNLMAIFSETQQLTAVQNDALNEAWEQLGNKAFAAANAGDKLATEAVEKMRDSKLGSRREGR